MTKRREFSASASTTRTFERAKWKHYVRWFAFLFVLVLDATLVASSINAHFIRHIPTAPLSLAREGIGFFLVACCHLMVVPSIVLEANKVEVTPERLILDNLIWRTKIKWEDITAFNAPRILKFAILRTKKFFYLINKRDIERYDDLAEIIEHKAPQLAKEI